MFKKTTSLARIRALKKRVKIIQGSSSSGKTISILIILIDKCTKTPNLEVSVISESVPHLKKGALKDFLKIMKETGRFIKENYNGSDRKYTFTNGAYIEFFSPEAVLGARRDVLFVNECINVSFEDYHQLAARTNQEIFLDFNPAREFWVQTELLGDADVEFLILTYRENEGCPEPIVRELEKARDKGFYDPHLPVYPPPKKDGTKGDGLFDKKNIASPYWANWWRVYGLGLEGTVQGIIYGAFNQVEVFPKNCKWVCYGLDFGYTNDPTALIKVGLFGGELYFEELIFETALTNSMISERLTELKISGAEIIADSSEPKSVKDLQLLGWNVRGAVKGPDSVINGIDTMKQYRHNIVKGSLNMIKEWRGYSYKFNKATNKFINEAEDHLNHTADAARYAVSYKMPRQNQAPAIVWQ